MLAAVDEVRCQERHTPRTTFACGLHDGDGQVEGGGEDALAHLGSGEEATMAREAVYLNLLVFEQDVVANLEHGHGAIEVGAHEVGQ